MASRKVRYALGAAVILVLVLGFIPEPQPADHFWEKLPVYEAGFGFLGCLLLIFASKALGVLFLQKREDYYDD